MQLRMAAVETRLPMAQVPVRRPTAAALLPTVLPTAHRADSRRPVALRAALRIRFAPLRPMAVAPDRGSSTGSYSSNPTSNGSGTGGYGSAMSPDRYGSSGTADRYGTPASTCQHRQFALWHKQPLWSRNRFRHALWRPHIEQFRSVGDRGGSAGWRPLRDARRQLGSLGGQPQYLAGRRAADHQRQLCAGGQLQLDRTGHRRSKLWHASQSGQYHGGCQLVSAFERTLGSSRRWRQQRCAPPIDRVARATTCHEARAPATRACSGLPRAAPRASVRPILRRRHGVGLGPPGLSSRAILALTGG